MDEVSEDEPNATGADSDSTSPPDGLDLARALIRDASTTGRRRYKKRPPPEGDHTARSAGGFSGSHPDDRDPQALSDQMNRLVDKQGWRVELQVRSVFARWPEIVGPHIAAHVRPTGFTDGRLRVRTDTRAWETELRLLLPALLRRLNEELGHQTVLYIDIETPASRPGARYRSTLKGPRKPSHD